MKNKTIVKCCIIGMASGFAGGFISGMDGKTSGLSVLLTLAGNITFLTFVIWAMIRLWKTEDLR
jgi:hypothetical protein